jgi:4-hydroxybenzoate polyprenyltransferase
MPPLRTLLILGRVSNLPTVWSNCLAGWLLGGGGNLAKLPFLFLGVTLLYLGGMFLNDAFDAEFDRQHRKERPIPSGAISSRLVWRGGFGMLLFGNALLFAAGITPGILGAVLALNILLYDAVHKAFTFSPIIMGVCRVLVYLVAAATGESGVTGYAAWGGLALGAYVVGLSFVARRESLRGRPPWWPVALLAVPVLLALLVNAGAYRESALLVALILTLWVLRALRTTYWTQMPNVGRTVSALLAGIVFVDWLAISHAPPELAAVFVALFVAALLCQRYVPAT